MVGKVHEDVAETLELATPALEVQRAHEKVDVAHRSQTGITIESRRERRPFEQVKVHSHPKRDRTELVDVVKANDAFGELEISDVVEARPKSLRSRNLPGAHPLMNERGQTVPLCRLQEESPID
jgi:hypothetical protein